MANGRANPPGWHQNRATSFPLHLFGSNVETGHKARDAKSVFSVKKFLQPVEK
jgi:hypothetical protein